MRELISSIGGPTLLIFGGALISAIGAVWASIDQNMSSVKPSEKNEEIARLSKEIANSVTGGNTVLYLAPDPDTPEFVNIVSHGGYPMYEVSVRIVDLESFEKHKGEPFTIENMKKHERTLQLGSIPPKSAAMLGNLLTFYGETRRWNIFFGARNGYFIQNLRMKKVGEKWVSASRVTREKDGETVIEYERIDDDYPRESDGTINWK